MDTNIRFLPDLPASDRSRLTENCYICIIMRRVLILILLAVFAVQGSAQDLAGYKKVVRDLSSARFQGRGYARDGANKAGKYLEKAYRKAGVDALTR